MVGTVGNISEQNKENGRYYGYEAQSNQLVEECAELIQAVNKYRRARGRWQVLSPMLEPSQEEKDREQVALSNLVEEIADVEIMLEQVKDLLQIPEEDIQAIKLYKVNRTRERIADKG